MKLHLDETSTFPRMWSISDPYPLISCNLSCGAWIARALRCSARCASERKPSRHANKFTCKLARNLELRERYARNNRVNGLDFVAVELIACQYVSRLEYPLPLGTRFFPCPLPRCIIVASAARRELVIAIVAAIMQRRSEAPREAGSESERGNGKARRGMIKLLPREGVSSLRRVPIRYKPDNQCEHASSRRRFRFARFRQSRRCQRTFRSLVIPLSVIEDSEEGSRGGSRHFAKLASSWRTEDGAEDYSRTFHCAEPSRRALYGYNPRLEGLLLPVGGGVFSHRSVDAV